MFTSTVRLICHSFTSRYADSDIDPAKQEQVVDFVLAEIRLQPRMIRVGLVVLTLLFRLCCWPLPLEEMLQRWSRSRLHYCRLLIRFYRSLVILRLFDHSVASAVAERPRQAAEEPDKQRTTVAVIGSGPGGAITAALLAEAGIEVTLIEEGQAASATTAYSCAEMLGEMRSGGLGVIPNRVPISYIEGRCVGGASEINSALYLRAHDAVLTQWSVELGLHNCSPEALRPRYELNEQQLKPRRDAVSAIGRKLQQGAESLGWAWECLATLHNNSADSLSRKRYTSMSRSFIPKMLGQGGTLLTDRRVTKLKRHSKGWQIEMRDAVGRVRLMYADQVVVAGGAIQTPMLLKRSTLGSKQVGKGLHSSLVVKVIAEFPGLINEVAAPLANIQIREFSPEMTFGCALSSQAQLMLGLVGYDPAICANWRRMAVYSLIYSPIVRGSVAGGGLGLSPEVEFELGEQDWRQLSEGMKRLMGLLLVSGAERLYPVAERGEVICSAADILQVPQRLDEWGPQLLMLHPSSTCAMSMSPDQGVVDSSGRVYGEEGLWIFDASILPSYPGANPQATLMALVQQQVQQTLIPSLRRRSETPWPPV